MLKRFNLRIKETRRDTRNCLLRSPGSRKFKTCHLLSPYPQVQRATEGQGSGIRGLKTSRCPKKEVYKTDRRTSRGVLTFKQQKMKSLALNNSFRAEMGLKTWSNFFKKETVRVILKTRSKLR
jgi:hypothetical protein